MIIVCSPNPGDDRHVARALALYARHLAQQGRRLPDGLRGAVVHVPAAYSGPQRPIGDVQAGRSDGDPMPLLLTYEQTAARIGDVSARTVRRLVAEGRLRAVELGTRRYIDPDDLEELVKSLPKTGPLPQKGA